MRQYPAARVRALLLICATLVIIALCPLFEVPDGANAGGKRSLTKQVDAPTGGIAGGDVDKGDGDGGGGDGGGGGDPPTIEPVLYSIDRAANTLTRIDPVSGDVTTIGPIGRDVIVADLAWLDGRLFAQLSDHATQTELVELDPTTGAIVTTVEMYLEGQPIPVAEGFATLDGVMYIGIATGSNASLSNSIGRVDTDGVVRDVTDLSSIQASADLDAMGFDPAGRLLGSDTQPGSGLVGLYDLSATANAYQLIGEFDMNGVVGSVNDVAFFDGQLLGLDDVTASLHIIDPETGGRLSTLTLNGAGDMVGLASGEIDAGEPTIDGDVNGDGIVDVADLVAVMVAWGPCPPANPCPADQTGDGIVNVQDIIMVLINWS